MIETAPVRGLWCATLTPLGVDGAIDHARLAAHVRALLAQGVVGVAPFGTTGEGPSFPVAARRAGIDALLAAGIPASRIIVATGCAAFRDAIELARHALSVGCPRCLVMPPFFFKDLSDAAVYRYYASTIDTVADARLAVSLYHIPQFSGVAIRPDVVARLAADYPHAIAGVKDSGGDFAYTQALLERVPQLAILVGHEPDLPRAMRAGGAGTICGIANIFPRVVAPLLAPTVNADDARRIGALLDVIFRYPFLPAFKAIRAAQTGDAAWHATAPPWLPLDEAAQASLLAALREAGFGIPGESAQ
jgi:4-hydroxy-tetrahydrodipicolinate synthase